MNNQFLVVNSNTGLVMGQFSLNQLLDWFDNDDVHPQGFTAVVNQLKRDGLTVARVL